MNTTAPATTQSPVPLAASISDLHWFYLRYICPNVPASATTCGQGHSFRVIRPTTAEVSIDAESDIRARTTCSDGGDPMPTWTTAATPRRHQFTYWREMICQAFHDLTPETRPARRLPGPDQSAAAGPHDLARIDSQAQRVRRTDADIARSPKSGFYANLQVRGVGLTTQDGRAAVTHPGDITLIDAGRPFTFEFSGDFPATLAEPAW